MDKKDLAQIKLGSAAFTSKWWRDRRSSATKGCGVAKALDAWQKDCPPDPDKIKNEEWDRGAAVAAQNASFALITAMTKAKAKCGKLQKDTADACDIYIKLAKDYRDRIGKISIEGAQDDQVWQKKVEPVMKKALATAKQVGADAAKHLKMLQGAIKFAGTVRDEAAKTATPDVKKMMGRLDGVRPHYKAAETFLQKTYSGAQMQRRDVDTEFQAVKTNKYEKAKRDFFKMFDTMMGNEKEFRETLFDCDTAIADAEAAINKTASSVDTVLKKVRTTHALLYENALTPVSDWPGILKGTVQKCAGITHLRGKTLSTDEQRKLREDVQRIKDSHEQDMDTLDKQIGLLKVLMRDARSYADNAEIKELVAQAAADIKKAQEFRKAADKSVEIADDAAMKLFT